MACGTACASWRRSPSAECRGTCPAPEPLSRQPAAWPAKTGCGRVEMRRGPAGSLPAPHCFLVLDENAVVDVGYSRSRPGGRYRLVVLSPGVHGAFDLDRPVRGRDREIVGIERSVSLERARDVVLDGFRLRLRLQLDLVEDVDHADDVTGD